MSTRSSEEPSPSEDEGALNLRAQVTVEDGVASCSIQETNRIREALGLKPLDVEGKKKELSPEDVVVPPTVAEIREAKEDAKRRRNHAKLTKGPGLADIVAEEEELQRRDLDAGDDEDLDPLLWVARMRKNEKEKALLAAQQSTESASEKGVKYGDEKDDPKPSRKAKRPASEELDLLVAHDITELAPGQETILTLADRPIINKRGKLTGDCDDDEGLALENINMAEAAKAAANLKEKEKTSVYDPTEDERIDPATGLPVPKDILAHYDEWLGVDKTSSGSGRKSHSFKVSVDHHSGRSKEIHVHARPGFQAIVGAPPGANSQSLLGGVSLDTPRRPIADNFTHAEMQKMKEESLTFRPRKKKVKGFGERTIKVEDEGNEAQSLTVLGAAKEKSKKDLNKGGDSQSSQPSTTRPSATAGDVVMAPSVAAGAQESERESEGDGDDEDVDERIFFEQLNRQRRMCQLRQQSKTIEEPDQRKGEGETESTSSKGELIIKKEEPESDDIDMDSIKVKQEIEEGVGVGVDLLVAEKTQWDLAQLVSSAGGGSVTVDNIPLQIVKEGLDNVDGVRAKVDRGSAMSLESDPISSAAASAKAEGGVPSSQESRAAVKLEDIEDASGRQTVLITSTTEFCRTVPTPLQKLDAQREAEKAKARRRDEVGGCTSIASRHTDGMDEEADSDDMDDDEDGDDSDEEPRNSVNRFESSRLKMKKKQKWREEKAKEEEEDLQAVGLLEADIDIGLAGALAYLQGKGDLLRQEAWRIGRHNRGNVPMFNDRDPNVYDGTRTVHRFMQKKDGQETKEGDGRHVRRDGRNSRSSEGQPQEQVKKESKFGDATAAVRDDDNLASIRFDYRDNYGRVLTPKEAFRQISWTFHGEQPRHSLLTILSSRQVRVPENESKRNC
eukprot:GHVN01052982.1.p1 GENE.GHVN01052982.1~~GHVN01052982.1.p1  ORF type:complete len:900 (-),score=192.34 GHVN01052982.1:1018-3717(-)